MHTAASPAPLTGRTVFLCLLAFFGVVIGVNAVMIKFAVDTLPGTDVDSAYRASLAYNGEIRAAHEQATRGWAVVAHVDRSAGGETAMQVEARDAAGVPIAGLAVSAILSRPTDKRADRVVALSERAPGVYAGRISAVARGQWDVVIEADRGAGRLFLSRSRVSFN